MVAQVVDVVAVVDAADVAFAGDCISGRWAKRYNCRWSISDSDRGLLGSL